MITSEEHDGKSAGSPVLTNTCLECGREYSIGRQPSPYCSSSCRERLTIVLEGRRQLRRDYIDHETIAWMMRGVRKSIDTPYGELWLLAGKPLSVDEPRGLPCASCGEVAVLRVRLGQAEKPTAHCLACYRKRLADSFMAPRSTTDPQAILARIFAPRPLFERDDEDRDGYRLLKHQAVKRRSLVHNPIPTDEVDLLAWSDAIGKRTAAAKREGIELLDALDDVLNDALDDLRLPARRRNRLVRRFEALIAEFGRSLDLPGHGA